MSEAKPFLKLRFGLRSSLSISLADQDGYSEQRIDKRRNRRSAREDDQESENQQNEDDWQKPVLLSILEESPEVSQKIHRFIPPF